MRSSQTVNKQTDVINLNILKVLSKSKKIKIGNCYHKNICNKHLASEKEKLIKLNLIPPSIKKDNIENTQENNDGAVFLKSFIFKHLDCDQIDQSFKAYNINEEIKCLMMDHFKFDTFVAQKVLKYVLQDYIILHFLAIMRRMYIKNVNKNKINPFHLDYDIELVYAILCVACKLAEDVPYDDKSLAGLCNMNVILLINLQLVILKDMNWQLYFSEQDGIICKCLLLNFFSDAL